MRSRALWVAAGACALALGACGGDDGGGGAGGGGDEAAQVEGAKVIDPASMDSPPKGTVKYCQGKDTTGIAKELIKDFNAKFGADGYNATLTEFPASADQQRQQFIQRQQAKSDDCDVFSADVIWTAEFASQKWLYDVTPYIEQRQGDFIEAPLETVNYGDKYWGIPQTSDTSFIFYKRDETKQPPETWQALYEAAAQGDGIVYQGAPYEGLTCNFLEIMFAAGGEVLNEDGTESTFDSPETVKALQFMVDGINDGAAPKDVTTYMEPETDQSWSSGNYSFMRNWTYAYAANNAEGSEVAGDYDVAAPPAFEGGAPEGVGVLGGHNSVISVYTKNPGLALKFSDFFASEEFQQKALAEFSQAAVIPSAYEDPAAKKAVPYSDQLLEAMQQARSRPVSPVYPQISQAIYKNVNDALAGRTSPEEAVKNADEEIQAALETF